MKFGALCHSYSRFETLSGNALRSALADFLKTVPTVDIKAVVYMTLGAIASDYDEINLGMADKMAIKAIALAAGKDEAKVSKEYKKKGDVGLVAESVCGTADGTLSVFDVFETLHLIATTSGTGSQEEKIRHFSGLLKKATPIEARYIGRLAVGKLRLGVAAKTVLDGLSLAYGIGKEKIEHAFNICPDIGIIAETVVGKGDDGISSIGVVVGRPVQMMLCQRVESLQEAIDKLGIPVAAEQKYDGERVQIHKDRKKVTLYSRRLENITSQFPELVKAASTNLNAASCIIEAEIMAVGKKGQLEPFQKLMSRRRKHGIEQMAKEIPAKAFCFELLYLNGKSLIKESYNTRYENLSSILRPNTSINLAQRVVCTDAKCIDALFKRVVGKCGEGVVIKSLRPDSDYQAGVRGWHWIKWKPEYSKGMQDTFDLAVIGAFRGRGRRSGRYGALLCAVYNKKTGKFESFCKLGSGFSDAELKSLSKKLTKSDSQPKNVVVLKQMTPDVWIQPTKVVEVLAAEITRSPFHAAGMKDGKGLALRFPRFLRWRDDKKAEQATTTKEISR
jgi:DNA ligase-1